MSVGRLVVFEVMKLHERFVTPTVIALIPLDTVVRSQVVIKLLLRVKSLVTNVAGVFNFGVNGLQVLSQIQNAFKPTIALRTNLSVLRIMRLLMGVAIRYGWEGFKANGTEMFTTFGVVGFEMSLKLMNVGEDFIAKSALWVVMRYARNVFHVILEALVLSEFLAAQDAIRSFQKLF